MAAQQDHQAIFALSLTCSHLAQDAVEACGDQVLFIRNEESTVRSCSQILSFNLKSVICKLFVATMLLPPSKLELHKRLVHGRLQQNLGLKGK